MVISHSYVSHDQRVNVESDLSRIVFVEILGDEWLAGTLVVCRSGTSKDSPRFGGLQYCPSVPFLDVGIGATFESGIGCGKNREHPEFGISRYHNNLKCFVCAKMHHGHTIPHATEGSGVKM